MALIGLWGGRPLLSSWYSGFPSMTPLGVLGITALGVALIYPGKDSRVAFAVGLAASALATLHFCLLLFDVEPGVVNRWLAPGVAMPAPSFRAASAAAVVFGLVGGSLALSRFERHRFAATVLAGVAGIVAVFALLGYLAGFDTLYGTASVSSPPVPAVVGMLCVAVGIILRIGEMPALRTSLPLGLLLTTLGCAIVVPLLLFDAYAASRIADAQLNQVGEELMSDARIISANVDREVVDRIETLLALSGSPSLHHGDLAMFRRQAEAALALRQSGNITLVDRTMRQLMNTSAPFGTSLPKAPVSEFVERALATGKPQVTGLLTATGTGPPKFGIIVPVEIDGENRYALVGAFSQRALVPVVAANELPPGRRLAVSDAARRVIVASEQEEALIGGELPPAQQHRAGTHGIFQFADAAGRLSLEAYTWSELTGWEIAVWAPKTLVDASVRTLWRTIGLTGG